MKRQDPPFNSAALSIIDNSPILKSFYETTVGPNGASKLLFQNHFPHYAEEFTSLMSMYRKSTKQ